MSVDGSEDTLAPSSPEPARPRPPVDPDAFPVPSWERYEPLGLLGRGGMGAVYRARDRRLGRVVALKFIRGVDPELTMRLVQEARAQARVDHPNVCKVFEVGEVDAKAYIAMQLVAGERLDRVAPKLTLPEKVQVVRDIALAMHEAHKLGIVHRDLKPANLMIERGDDGRPFPVVMDFGLAHETGGDMGLTRTGALIGTPAYMPPEQARGDTRAIDRRSDVYSLGATLYELLAGEPPFVGATPLMVMERVMNQDAPSLRGRVPQLPRDLETIALKCLRKEMSQRYESARALAEDLQRYIDGDPIVGARPTLASRLRRWARRHRALVAVSAVSLLLILVAGAFGLRSLLVARRTQARSAERARLAEQLGQDVKEIEWFLRTVHTLPLHDTTPEQKLIRARMERIAARRDEGAAHYALGRAHLALGELDRAWGELEQARRMGLDTPELHFARGRVLGELYHRALEEARLSGDKKWLAGEQQRLEAEYLAPAVASLERSRGLELESPRYLEGLIALYRGDHAAAVRAADLAAAEAPWLTEARKLGGDAAYARAQGELDRGAYDAARTGFIDAIARYQTAAEVGRSDPQLHEALSAAWLAKSEVEWRQGTPALEEALTRSISAAEHATGAAPGSSAGYTRMAFALLRLYRAPLRRSDDQSVALLQRITANAAQAVTMDARQVAAHDALGIAQMLHGLFEWRHDRDPSALFADAVTSFERALQQRPNYPWALNDLGVVRIKRGNLLAERGKDPRPEYDAAVASFQRAVAADPAYLFAYINLEELVTIIAQRELEHGRDPRPYVRRAAAAGERAVAIDAKYVKALTQLALGDLIESEYLSLTGGQPDAALARAVAHLESAAARSSDFQNSIDLASAHEVLARQQVLAGVEPAPAIARGRQAIGVARRLDPTCSRCSLLQGRLTLDEADRAGRAGQPAQPLLRRALAELVGDGPWLRVERARTLWRLAVAEGAPDRARAGLVEIGRALEQDPDDGEAHALRAALLVACREGAEARAELARAYAINPLLKVRYAEVEKAAQLE